MFNLCGHFRVVIIFIKTFACVTSPEVTSKISTSISPTSTTATTSTSPHLYSNRQSFLSAIQNISNLSADGSPIGASFDGDFNYHDISRNSSIPGSDDATTVDGTTNSSSFSTLRCPKEGELPMRVLGAFVSCLFLLVGTAGNLCVIAVVAKTKSLRRHPTNWYLASVAMADFIILWSAAFPTILEFQTSVGEWVFGGRVGCSAAVFLQYLGINVSSIFIMTFSLERYVAICHPMRAMVLCTVSRAKKIVATVWLFGSIYCAPWLFLSTTIPRCNSSNFSAETSDSTTITATVPINGWMSSHGDSNTTNYELPRERVECTFKLQRSHYTTYYMTDFIIFYIIPLTSTCALYILIGRAIRFNGDKPSVLQRDARVDRQLQRWSKSLKYFTSRVQVVKMLAIVVAVFAISWLPYRVFVVYNSFARVRFISPWFLTFCRLAIYFNSTINPILYNLMSAKFRKAFYQLFLCTQARGLESFASRTALHLREASTTMTISEIRFQA